MLAGHHLPSQPAVKSVSYARVDRYRGVDLIEQWRSCDVEKCIFQVLEAVSTEEALME